MHCKNYGSDDVSCGKEETYASGQQKVDRIENLRRDRKDSNSAKDAASLWMTKLIEENVALTHDLNEAGQSLDAPLLRVIVLVNTVKSLTRKSKVIIDKKHELTNN